MENTLTSFVHVLAKETSSILIPEIQRDYAQGRMDVDAIAIRSNILQKIFHALDKEETLDLDFVYGEINEENSLIPLDGQQRLTTIFLLHWYLSKRVHDQYIIDLLSKFRYQTRPSSATFCETVLSAEIDFFQSDLGEYIQDQKWFLHGWKKDPTIKSMLVMIQAIHETFSEVEHETFLRRLTQDQRVVFNYLSFKNDGQSDDLYIKMNARGLPLSRFENLKVWIEKKHPDNKEWQRKIDTDWANLFWKKRKLKSGDNEKIDNLILQFWNTMLMFRSAISSKTDHVNYLFNSTDNSLAKYEGIDAFSAQDLDFVENCLDAIVQFQYQWESAIQGIELWEGETNHFDIVISQERSTYKQRVYLFAILKFLIEIKNGDDFDSQAFQRWIRIARNLIENTQIDNDATFASAINSLSRFGPEVLDIHRQWGKGNGKIAFFNTEQLVEESRKLEMIERNPAWEREFIGAEKHKLFRGCINFLLQEYETITIEEFGELLIIAQRLFALDGSQAAFKEKQLLMRCTLAKSDFDGNVRMFDNAEYWRLLLKNEKMQRSIDLILKQLKSVPVSNYVNELGEIIDTYVQRTPLWKYYAVKTDVLFEWETSRSKFFKEYGGVVYLFNNEGGNWINNDYQFLVSNLRNELISELLARYKNFELDRRDAFWVKTDLKTGVTFYRGHFVQVSNTHNSREMKLSFGPTSVIIGFPSAVSWKLEIASNQLPEVHEWAIAKRIPYTGDSAEIGSWVDNLLSSVAELELLVKVK